MNNNVKTIKTNKTSKLATYRKAVITSSLVAMLIATSTISAAAATAPDGVDTSSMSIVIEVIFWLIRIAIGAYTLVPGILNFAKGQSQQDERLRNDGVTSCIIGVACIGALEVIKGIAF